MCGDCARHAGDGARHAGDWWRALATAHSTIARCSPRGDGPRCGDGGGRRSIANGCGWSVGGPPACNGEALGGVGWRKGYGGGALWDGVLGRAGDDRRRYKSSWLSLRGLSHSAAVAASSVVVPYMVCVGAEGEGTPTWLEPKPPMSRLAAGGMLSGGRRVGREREGPSGGVWPGVPGIRRVARKASRGGRPGDGIAGSGGGGMSSVSCKRTAPDWGVGRGGATEGAPLQLTGARRGSVAGTAEANATSSGGCIGGAGSDAASPAAAAASGACACVDAGWWRCGAAEVREMMVACGGGWGVGLR